MIIFKKLKFQNFLSYGNNLTTINLDVKDPVLITGINYDASINGEFDSNGCGKSAILNAISYALYNKTISINEKLGDLINNINKKDMLVCLEFSVDKQDYRVTRFRKNKAMGGDGVLVEQKKGKSWKDITTMKSDQLIANDILKIPYTIFNRIIGYAAGEEPFLKQGLAKQREVIDELFDYVELSKRAENLKEILKGYKKDLQYAESSNEEIKKEAIRHKTQLDDIKSRLSTWEKENKKEIKNIESKINDFSNVSLDDEYGKITKIESIKKKISEYESEKNKINQEKEYFNHETTKFLSFDEDKKTKIDKLKRQIDDLKSQDINLDEEKENILKIESKSKNIQELEQNKKEYKNEIEKISKAIDKIKEEKSHLDDKKCPYCLQKYEDAVEKITELEKEYKQLTVDYDDMTEKLETLVNKIDSTKIERKNILSQLHFDNMPDLMNFSSMLEKKESKLVEIEEMDNPHSDKSDDIKRLKKEINSLEEKIEKEYNELSVLEKDSKFNNMVDFQEAKNKLQVNEEKLKSLKEQENPYIEMLNEIEKYEPKRDKDDEIKQLKDDIKHCEFLIKLLTQKNSYLRRALMDKYLPLLNSRLYHYLTMMSLPHKVLFKSDLTTEITQFDQEIPYGNLSAGQKARINIALSLAFRDVLQAKHNFINLFILDECLDVGLSNVGVKKTVKAIKEVTSQHKLSMFVISHRDEAKDSFPNTLNIELKNGFSDIASS